MACKKSFKFIRYSGKVWGKCSEILIRETANSNLGRPYQLIYLIKRALSPDARYLWDLVTPLVSGSWKSNPAQLKTMAKVVADLETGVGEMICISTLVSRMSERGAFLHYLYFPQWWLAR